MTTNWWPGSAAVWRSVQPSGVINYALPATVVVNCDEVIGLHQPPGVVCKTRTGKRGGPNGRSLVPGSWDGRYRDRVWNGNVVRLHVVEAGYSIIRSWDPVASAFQHDWYINLELPWRETSLGFDSLDLTLDIVVGRDLSSWAWKDEDELRWKRDVGVLDDDLVNTAYRHGHRAVHDLTARSWPFDPESWRSWEPDAQWPVPTLPDDWQLPADWQH